MSERSVTVLHVLEAIEAGTARHLANVVRYADVDHVVVVPRERVGGLTDADAVESMRAAGARVEFVDMRRSSVSPRNVAAVARVRRLIRQARADVVHGHSSIGGAVARLAATGTGAIRVYTPNGLFPARRARAVERSLNRLTDWLIAASASEAELAHRRHVAPPERTVVIPNAITLEDPPPATIDLRREFGIDSTTPLVGTVARLAHQKAPEVFVRACARVAQTVPEAHFVMIGSGPLEGLVRAEVAAAGLDGRVWLISDSHEGERLMGQFDVFVLASRYEAGCTYATMEAMRARTPVVVTDVVGNRDSVTDGDSGFVVAPDDPGALADAVTKLLVDDALRSRMASAARARVEEIFDVRRFGARLGEFYRSIT